MAPQNYAESISSGAACLVGVDFGTDSVRSIVAGAPSVLGTQAMSCAKSLGRPAVKSTMCGPKPK
jgi:hypothetical protein